MVKRLRSEGRAQIPWAVWFVLLALTLGCSAAGLAQRVIPTPAPTRALAPTFTPTPETILPQIAITPPQNGTPGVIVIEPGMNPSDFIPTATLIPQPNGTPVPGTELTPIVQGTELTPVEPTPTFPPPPPPTIPPPPTPTPFIVVESGLVSLRSGPGVEYPLVAQLGPRIPIAIIGQNPEGAWYQLCCVNGNTVWVTAAHVVVNNDPSSAPLLAPEPPPPPTPTPLPTETPTITPTPTATTLPFERRQGPEFFPTNNEFLTIWVKLFIGTPPTEVPADGYFLKVLFNGVERLGTNGVRRSAPEFYAVGGQGSGYSNLSFNLKYEYTPPDPKSIGSTQTRLQLLGTGNWQVSVVDGAGNQLSDVVTFRTESAPGDFREVYITWARIR